MTVSKHSKDSHKADDKPGKTDTEKNLDRAPSYPPRRPRPPDSLPNPMPGIDPQQTPGTDHLPAEST